MGDDEDDYGTTHEMTGLWNATKIKKAWLRLATSGGHPKYFQTLDARTSI
jgi:hypothetical protein